ncbi:IPT/TIG domain-containing protein [Clostridiaceae bacterium HSG29]|nr:IPT/TIG domain-containing protein [Clostridiaceae bacterium HSG29]
MNKKRISMLIVIMLLIVIFSGNSFATFDMGDDINVDSVRYVKEHNGFSLISSYIEINGSGLLDQIVRFEKTGIGGGFQTMGDQAVNEEGFLKFTFDIEDSNSFGGKIKINGKEIDLNLTGFANITGADKKNVNVDADDADNDIIFYGNYLDTIGGTATAEFGRGSQTKTFTESGIGASAPESLMLNNPTAPGDKGYQNILINRITAEVLGVAPEIVVENLYANGFRIIEDIGITELHMYPNTGAKNDIANLTGEGFVDTKDYFIYFLKSIDGSDDYSVVNQAEIINLELDANGTEDKLSFRVPNNNDFELRNYYVVLTDIKSNEVIAEQVVMKDDNVTEDIFTVIDSSYIPTITQVYPESGSDAGSDVQISGRNILTLNIPDLTATGEFLLDPEGLESDQKLHLNYVDGVYQEKAVTIDRYVTIQIGKKVSFVKDINDDFVISKAIPDSLLVHTQSIDDAIDDPFKDIIIEIETIMVDGDSKQYTFKQIVTKTDGYEFIPSTLSPIINEITPNIIQVKDNVDLNKFAKDTLFAIKGEKFLVDREVTPEGDIITKYPTVLIKKDDTNTFETKYQVGFFPNEETTYSGEVIRGIIKYKDELEVEHTVVDADGKPIKLNIKVVDDNGNIVNGTTGNVEGTKILIMIPNETLIEDIGIKHIQVSNIMRDSDEYGSKSIMSDSIEFIKTTEVPIIESVTPHIITVEGEEEIVIVGTNFQEGVKVILDGEEITPVQRNIDVQGEKIELIFTAPKGREGTTQIQVINPGGGIDVRDFMYVKTFNKDPYVYSFTPEKGTAQTLVVVNGDNYLKPDPTASSTIGLDAFRLVGTRLFLDGKDINQYNYDSYNNISFNSYSSPGSENLIKEVGSKAVFSNFKENVLVKKNSDGSLFYLDNDENNNPLITDGNEEYSIRYEGAVFNAYDNITNTLLGEVTITEDAIAIASGETFDVTMDNNVLRIMEDEKGTEYAEVADYVDSIILEDATDENVFYSLTKNLNNEIILSNGKDEKYIITYDLLDQVSTDLMATEGTAAPIAISVTNNQLNLNGNLFNFITAYVIDSETGEITGDKTRILNKNQIAFNVPVLQTGKGYKDIFIVNPDTKTAGFEDEEGFYYIEQSMSHPVISKIVPNKGSIDGGYSIIIEGSDFEDDTKVYIDGALVPIEDTYVNMDGDEIVIKVPKCTKNLSDDYGVDELKVPVIILNKDGGSDYREKGFTYMIPISSPVIEEVFLTEGSANGGEIVEIIGYEFRYFEPYVNVVGGPEYNPGDDFEDIYQNDGGREWDDLLDSNVDPDAIQSISFDNDDYDTYYESPILPTIYFGEKKGQIVEFAKGYIKVISPSHDEGTVELYLVNNDYGVSNKIDYKYISSTPQITSIIPDVGRKSGQEYKDVYGTQFDTSVMKGYQNNIDDTISTIISANVNVRFGNIDNLDTDLFDQNSGRINAQRAEVNLLGGLKVKYYGDTDILTVQIEENNIRYTRDFTNYDDSEVYIPSEMLKSSADNYYVPFGLKDVDNSIYNNVNYEFIKVFIKDKRLFVERGYAPSANYDNYNHIILRTPNYYTIGTVNVTFKNPDGGSAIKTFTYTNPASEPKILKINPRVLSIDEDRWIVNGTIEGIKEIEIVGKDFRDNVNVSINGKNATVEEIVETDIDGEVYQVIIAQIPTGSELDVEKEYPVIIINEDSGIANSALLENLLDPVDEYIKMPYYFQYKKPLSGPQIETITPSETSVAGGNKIVITGKDFRQNGYVIIGSRGGVPIYDVTVNDTGSIIEFITPTGLTVGDKDVQVLNEDYGIDIVKDGIKIVSHPEVDSDVYTEDGTEIKTRVSVEGGDKIRLKGTGFLENPIVLFGGTYSLRLTEDQEGDVGLNENDEYYIVENGIEATNVEYIDSENIIVTSPPIESEKIYHIVVINSDSGISKDNAIIDYRVPIPSDPVNLEVELIDNRYIKIFNYSSEDVDYFEIYSYLGDKSETKLINNDYMDFSYIDTTKLEPYKITNLPGVENMDANDKLYLVLKAVNKYGPSNWSNIVSLDYDELEDVEEIGPPDDDKDLGVEEGLNYEEVHTENEVTVNIADKSIDPTVVITLTDLDDRSTKIINIPGNKVINNTSLIAIDFGDTQLQFTPISFNTQEFRELNFYNDTYARINNEFIDNDYTSILKNYLPRGKKAISKVYKLDFYAMNNIETSEIKELNGNINFGITYDDMYLNESDNVGLFRFNGINSWNEVNAIKNETRNTLTTDAKISGYYIILKY